MASVMGRSIKDAALAIAKFQSGYIQRLTRGFAITGEQLIPFGAIPGRQPGQLEYKEPGAKEKNVEALFKFVESKWGTMLDRLRNSWVQLASDMTDIWQIFANAIGEAGVLDAMKSLLAYVRDLYEYLRDAGVVEKWAKAIGAAWSPIIDSVGPFLERLPGIIETIVGWIVSLGDKTGLWLDKMGGVEGLWDKIVAGFKQHAPEVIQVLHSYAQIMIGLSQAMIAMAGGYATYRMQVFKAIGDDKQAAEMDAIAAGLMTAYEANTKLKESISGYAASGTKFAKNLNLTGGPGGVPGYSTTDFSGGGGELGPRAAAAAIGEGAAAGSEAGVITGLEKFFGKSALEKSKGQFNPFVELALAMTGGAGGGAQKRNVATRPLAPGAPGYDKLYKTIYGPQTAGPVLTDPTRVMSMPPMPRRPQDPRNVEIEVAAKRAGVRTKTMRDMIRSTGASVNVSVENYIGKEKLDALVQDINVERERQRGADEFSNTLGIPGY
jgi:hypothetical protein